MLWSLIGAFVIIGIVLTATSVSANEKTKKGKKKMEENVKTVNTENAIVTTGTGNSILWILLSTFGFNIVRPTRRGLIERLGKFNRFASPGFNFTLPIIERMIQVNITEQMISSGKREMITKDRLNALVDAQIYFKVKPTDDCVKASQYNVNDYQTQIVALAKTTLRNIIGTLELKVANSDRNKINEALLETLTKETGAWGIEIVRTELKEIDPPKDVQDSMNRVVKAENEKIAAIDFATSVETQADGKRRAAIKEADGVKQATILEAEGKAGAIKLVNEAAEKYFIGNAQVLKKLETVQSSLEKNSKIIVPSGSSLVNLIGNLTGENIGG